MKTFLDQLAEEIVKIPGNDYSPLCVVLPNRRAGVFLREALTRASKSAIWAPKIQSIEDFVFEISGLNKVDRSSLPFRFYDVYSTLIREQQPFQQFIGWAPNLLADFNELDMNMLDAKNIFAHLDSIERIEKWNPSGQAPSKFQQEHIKFVQSFHGLYSELRKQLAADNCGYQGVAFRKAAEDLIDNRSKVEFERIWFAGFNALTVSEEQIFKTLISQGLAKVFWDMDSYYADDPIHEAGFYIRKYANGNAELKLSNEFNWKQPHFSMGEKRVQIIAAQRNIAQVRAAASILNKKLLQNGAESLSRTAVVLNDEKLLLPLLEALPTQLSGVNVTMGFGLQYSQVAVFIDKLFLLHLNSEFNAEAFHYEPVLAVLTNGVYLTQSKRDVAELRKKLIRSNSNQLHPNAIIQSDFDKLLFGARPVKASEFLIYLKSVSSFLLDAWKGGETQILESKFLLLLDRVTTRLIDLEDEFGTIESIKTLHTLWRQFLTQQRLDFVGEPIGGLQVMGMLETRNLDFDEVIILGTNEGVLPSSSQSASYFTFDVRRAFGLACQNERDAVTAYHFYRLLQRSRAAYLIYDEDSGPMGGGEKSRYIQQLLLEAPKNVKIEEYSVGQPVPTSSITSEFTIEKSEVEMEKLRELAVKGFSPSALNTFRSCALKYYLRYVAGFKETEELSEDVDHASLGTIIHDTLEQLYKPTVGKALTVDILNEMKTQLKSALTMQFERKLPASRLNSGRNILAFEVAKKYVKRVVDHDLTMLRKGAVITPISLEENLSAELDVTVGGKATAIKVHGKADRIDRLSDRVRLIDFKTGSPDKKSTVKDQQSMDSSKADHAFQLLLYSLMFSMKQENSLPIQPTVFYLRTKNVEKKIRIEVEKVELSYEEALDFAKEQAVELLSKLFDPEIPFEQTSNTTNCSYCDFKEFCQR